VEIPMKNRKKRILDMYFVQKLKPVDLDLKQRKKQRRQEQKHIMSLKIVV